MPMPRGICQRCGFDFKLSQLRKEWTGVKACYGAGTNDCWDAKNPQLSVRGVSDRQAVRGAAPEPADTFLDPWITQPDDL